MKCILNWNLRGTYFTQKYGMLVKWPRMQEAWSSLKTQQKKKIAIDFLAVGSLSNRLFPILLTPGLLEPFSYWVSTHMETS